MFHLAHLGHSAAFLARGGTIERLTRIHDAISLLAEQQGVSCEEMRDRERWTTVLSRRSTNILCRYLGAAEPELTVPDLRVVSIHAGDRVLLCTDGLSNIVAERQLLDTLRAHRDVQVCADTLCAMALELGSRDNVSCVVIEAA